MTGRLENKLKTEEKILRKLEHYDSNLQEYYYYMDAQGKSHKTKNNYICYILAFLKKINKEINNITSLDVNKYITSLSNSEKPQVRKQLYALACGFYYAYVSVCID